MQLCSDIPSEFICPITSQVMREPYVMPDGHTYEKDAIQKALQIKQESPITRQKMRFEEGRINYSILNMINEFRQNLCGRTNRQNYFASNQNESNKMHINVNDIDGNLLTLKCFESDTLSTFKKELYKLNGVEEQFTYLTYNGKPLSNPNLTLKEYGFQNNGRVHISFRGLGGIFD